MNTYYQPTQRLFWLTLIGLLTLFGYSKLIMPEQIERIHWILLGIQSLPLLAFVPFLLKPTSRTFQWFCFMLLWYFIVAVVSVFHPGMYYIGILESVLVGLLFTAAMMLGRWKM
jgi:uncharacterized membrane protein